MTRRRHKLPKLGVQIAIQVSLLFACLLASRFVDHALIAVIWLTFAISLSFLWKELDDSDRDRMVPAAPSAGYRYNFFQLYAPLIFGIVMGWFAASADISIARINGLDVSLVGVPFMLPVGSIFLGALTAAGYAFGLGMVHRRLRLMDYLLSAACAFGSFLYMHGCFFWSGHFAQYSEFLRLYFKYGPVWFSQGGRAEFAFAGGAPWPPFTPVMQMLGFILGSVFTSLRVRSKRAD